MNITGTLPANIKALILQALRNPAYKQTTGAYELHGCYCAAGATMREAQAQGLLVMTPTLADLLDRRDISVILNELHLNDVRIDDDTYLANHIFHMNDEGQTFEEIATHLEQEVFPYV